MADQLPPEPAESRKKGGWRRPLSYLLLIAGAAGIIFNNQISQNTGISVTILQIVTFGLFIAGAVLFYSVRESADRFTSYRQVFSADDRSSEPPTNDPKAAGPSDKQPPA